MNEGGEHLADRITWTVPDYKRAVSIVELIFHKASVDYPAAVADLKIYYKLPGRYRSLVVDEWIDGRCLKHGPNGDISPIVKMSSNAMTISKGKQYCYKMGFAYALLWGETWVRCQNTIWREFDDDKCISKCIGDSSQNCGSETHFNVYSTTGKFYFEILDQLSAKS